MKLFTHIIIVFLVTMHVPHRALCALRASALRKLPLAARRVPLSAASRLSAKPLARPRPMPTRSFFCDNLPPFSGACIACDIGCGVVGGFIGSACGITVEFAARLAIASFKKEPTDKVIEKCLVLVPIKISGWALGGLVGSAVAGGPLGSLAYTGALAGTALLTKSK